MGPQHGHPHAGGGEAQIRQTHDLAGLVHHLHLLLAIAVGLQGRVVQKEVERQGVRQHLSFGSAAIQHRLRQVFQLFHGPGTGTTGGLIGAHHHPAHRPLGRQRSQSQGEQDRGAIRIGDHALMGEGCIGIDLGHHQRHTVLHPEGTGVIHHHRTGCGDRFAPLLGNRTTG